MNKNDIKTLRQMANFVLYMNLEVWGEAMKESLPIEYPVSEASKALVKHGVITQRLADAYVKKFDTGEGWSMNFDEVLFLTQKHGYTEDDEYEMDDIIATLCAAILLENDAEMSNLWESYEEAKEDYGEEYDGEEELDEEILDMLPLDIK